MDILTFDGSQTTRRSCREIVQLEWKTSLMKNTSVHGCSASRQSGRDWSGLALPAEPKTGTWQTVVTMPAEPQSSSMSLLPVIQGKRIKHTIVQGPFSLDQINQTWGNTIFRQGRHFKITERENGKWVVLIRGPSSGVVGICMPFGFLHLMWVLGLHAQTENYTLAHIKS